MIILAEYAPKLYGSIQSHQKEDQICEELGDSVRKKGRQYQTDSKVFDLVKRWICDPADRQYQIPACGK